MKKNILLLCLIIGFISSAQNINVDGLLYGITSSSEVEVRFKASDNNSPDIIIPNFIIYNSKKYTVTSIGFFAFSGQGLESVVIPSTVQILQDEAFVNNQLTSVVLPASITSIGAISFTGNPITSVTSLSTNPATLSVFNDRPNIDLFIPINTSSIYTEKGWTGFKSVTENITLELNSYYLNEFNIYIDKSGPKLIIDNINDETNFLKVVIYDSLGKQVISSHHQKTSLMNLKHGVYLVKVITKKGAFSKKIAIN